MNFQTHHNHILPIVLLLTLVMAGLSACTSKKTEDIKHFTVSLPVEKYFIDQLLGQGVYSDKYDVNIMIPQSAGHSDYSPLPRQMMKLAQSDAYFAIGALDFEITWKERLISSGNNLNWIELNRDINMIRNNEDDEHEHDAYNHHHHHAVDPHYWLSPRQVLHMVDNLMTDINKWFPGCQDIDSSYAALRMQIQHFDDKMKQAATHSKAFMIYHPALTYVAQDYGITQLEIEKDGNAPSPQQYISQITQAKANSVSVVFVQQGYDIEKAQKAAQMIGARVVTFNPEGYNWAETMNTIINALSTDK